MRHDGEKRDKHPGDEIASQEEKWRAEEEL